MGFCNAKRPEECSYRIELIKSPAEMPLNDIVKIMSANAWLQAEVNRLNEEVEIWKAKAQSNWDILESVATGEKLQCAKCGHDHPCRCDDGQ